MHLLTSVPLLAIALLASPALTACPYAGLSARSQDQKSAKSSSPLAFRQAPADKKGVFYMNRIAPSVSTLYIADADGSNEQPLLAAEDSVFEYHGHFTPDGQQIVFTSEREDGNADLYIANLDGSNVTLLVSGPAHDDNGVVSPDGTKLAYVSTASHSHTANIWVLDIATGQSSAISLTDQPSTIGLPTELSPGGHFQPKWSPDGEWILFSSDRNTDWTGHSNGTGWEHTQELSIYAIRPDGSGLFQVATKPGYSLGSPSFSADGTRIAYYEMTLEDTYFSHGGFGQANATSSQIVTAAWTENSPASDRIEVTSGAGLKLSPSFIGNDSISLGYLVKALPIEGVNYTTPTDVHQAFISSVRSVQWSPDRTKIVYERYDWSVRELEKKIYSWQDDYEYRFMDVFPQLSKQGKLVYTQFQSGPAHASVITANANNSDQVITIPEPATAPGGSFQPVFSPDGDWVAAGLGYWFTQRVNKPGWLWRAKTDGSFQEQLIKNSTGNIGFPSYSPDGTQLVYRSWDTTTGAPLGLKILNLTSNRVTRLTNGWDNTPGWSPDGASIVFARQSNWTVEYGPRWYADRFDVYTISPDGTDLKKLTTSGANDAHPVWTADNRILYNSGMYGFREECALYDNTFQPYGMIISMNRDGSDKTILTDSMWEDSMPLYVPNEYLV